MTPTLDVAAVTHSVQLAVAPVFFLTAVAGLIGAVAARLARIIDRARLLDERVRTSTDAEASARMIEELLLLRKRGRIANFSIACLALCGCLIGVTIISLFLGQTWEMKWHLVALVCFLAGVLSFLAALGSFLWETILAMHLLNFRVLETTREQQR